MGAWSFVAPRLEELLPPRKRFLYAGRNASASPAVGAKTLHDREQKQLVAEAFSLCKSSGKSHSPLSFGAGRSMLDGQLFP